MVCHFTRLEGQWSNLILGIEVFNEPGGLHNVCHKPTARPSSLPCCGVDMGVIDHNSG